MYSGGRRALNLRTHHPYPPPPHHNQPTHPLSHRVHHAPPTPPPFRAIHSSMVYTETIDHTGRLTRYTEHNGIVKQVNRAVATMMNARGGRVQFPQTFKELGWIREVGRIIRNARFGLVQLLYSRVSWVRHGDGNCDPKVSNLSYINAPTRQHI